MCIHANTHQHDLTIGLISNKAVEGIGEEKVILLDYELDRSEGQTPLERNGRVLITTIYFSGEIRRSFDLKTKVNERKNEWSKENDDDLLFQLAGWRFEKLVSWNTIAKLFGHTIATHVLRMWFTVRKDVFFESMSELMKLDYHVDVGDQFMRYDD